MKRTKKFYFQQYFNYRKNSFSSREQKIFIFKNIFNKMIFCVCFSQPNHLTHVNIFFVLPQRISNTLNFLYKNINQRKHSSTERHKQFRFIFTSARFIENSVVGYFVHSPNCFSLK